ncbi:NAD(P)/FAD-dependent oxidoreductase [Microbacterium sp. SSW1-59]|uniref:phytoene desaturase family protein n=1 Tax=Microbacterium xanthum TaxID=3079794 RepID=UPI002AD35A46|nr:NAD(P)/FAD-dependent oxidoreductase [Microbacterium sp. SSW1-59]MDZ8200186.1 NAD(P)/FAD-dependent oxidoreductase [Microbacterium sp. SSW1-59]
MGRRATVVGSGPNGLAAAVSLARAGYDVRVVEAFHAIGGGVRTAGLTLPGFRHDVGSAVHPAARSSLFFRAFGLSERIEWITPEASYAQPLDDGRAAIAWNDLERTVDGLGPGGRAYRRLVAPLTRRLGELVEFTGDQLLRVPRHPLVVAGFGARMLATGTRAGRPFFSPDVEALLAGVLAHGNTRLPSLAAAASGLFLAAHAHSAEGWSLPRGGAQRIADTLVEDLKAHGGMLETGVHVRNLAELDWGDPDAGDLLLLDTAPRLLLSHPDIPDRYARAIRAYRHGSAAAKVDFALDGPVPWAADEVGRAPTVHLGGSRAEVEEAENAVAAGRVPHRPYVLAVQPTTVDPSRAPDGKHVLWAYIHVPPGSTLDPTEAVIRQVERFAPGFRRRVIASHAVTAAERSRQNPSDVDGDILGGAFTITQAVRRPVLSRTPWRTPMPGVYLASASTPPGPGVTGMPGWHAARQALTDRTGVPVTLDDLFG